ADGNCLCPVHLYHTDGCKRTRPVDHAAQPPRYSAKVVACMAGQIHRLRETADTFLAARRPGRRNRIFVSRSRQWNHVYFLREGMDGSAKAVPSRMAVRLAWDGLSGKGPTKT